MFVQKLVSAIAALALGRCARALLAAGVSAPASCALVGARTLGTVPA
jgi:hypothetical protein